MAAGDIVSATVGADGWWIDLVIEGAATGGTYQFGLSPQAYPSAATPTLVATSLGFTPAGAATTIARTAHLTTVMRQPYPNDALRQEASDGTNLTVRIALSTPVFAKDKTGAGNSGTDPVLTVPAGFLTAGAVASKAATITCVNNSTLPYPQVIAKHGRPDRYRLTSTSVQVSVIALHGHPRNNQPVACVKFTATDAHGHTATTTVTGMTVDAGYGDAVPVNEYLATLDLTGFTDGDLITVQHVAYPWVGDTAACIDTAAAAHNEVTGMTPPAYYVLDVAGARGYPIAVVDPTTGNDTTGVVLGSDTAPNRTTAAATPFLTIKAAAQALRAYNSTTNGKSSLVDCTLYLANGTHAMTGGTGTITDTALTTWSWFTVAPLPGQTSVLVTPDATGGNRGLPAMGVRLKGLAFTRSTDADWIRGNAADKVLFEDCAFVDTRGGTNTYGIFSTSFGRMWRLRCTITDVTSAQQPASVRGCTFPGGRNAGVGNNLFVGNLWTQNTAGTVSGPFSTASTAAQEQGGIVFCNKFVGLKAPALSLFGVAAAVYTIGVAVVQNLFEFLDTGGQPGARFHADAVTSDMTSAVVMNNNFIGQRNNMFYNTIGGYHATINNTVALNLCEYLANKTDTFTGSDVADGTRTGNWSIYFGVRCHGNRVVRGAFDQFFRGLYSYGGTDAYSLDLGYAADKSWSTAAPRTGGGDYHPIPSSPARGIPVSAAVPYDLDGKLRDVRGAGAGCYTAPYHPLGTMAV